MAADKNDILYEEIRFELLRGKYIPGDRITLAAVARDHRTSNTPARFVLNRLVGEGVISRHGRDGYHVHIPTEAELWDLYDEMQHRLSRALAVPAPPAQEAPSPPIPRTSGIGSSATVDDGSIVTLTRHLFETIGHRPKRPWSFHLLRITNDKLSQVRRAELEAASYGSAYDPAKELSTLGRHWQRRELEPLESALAEYHDRRKRLGPSTVAILADHAKHRSTAE